MTDTPDVSGAPHAPDSPHTSEVSDSREAIAVARSFLFVPGDRPDRYAKAHASGADLVIIDLEDAVATADKDEARTQVAAWLASGHRPVVRVNALDADVTHGRRLLGQAGRTG